MAPRSTGLRAHGDGHHRHMGSKAWKDPGGYVLYGGRQAKIARDQPCSRRYAEAISEATES